jgi:hypothetical protein
LTALLKYNILVIVLHAKTSIWSQPADNGKNELANQAISEAAHRADILNSNAWNHLETNRVFREGLETNCEQQNDELCRANGSAVKNSFIKCGVYPLDYKNIGWCDAIEKFGPLNELVQELRHQNRANTVDKGAVGAPTAKRQAYIVYLKSEDKRRKLSAAEVVIMETAYLKLVELFGEEDEDIPEFLRSGNIPSIIIAYAIGNTMLVKHINDPDTDSAQPPQPDPDCP